MIFSELENIRKVRQDNFKVVSSLFDSSNRRKMDFYFLSVSDVLMDIYSAAGQKVKKRVYDMTATPNATIKHVDYLDGFQYAGEVLQFFPHAEGYVSATPGSTTAGGTISYIFNYVYNYTDHLGNIRMSYTKDPVNGQLKIMEENHYYPFGLKHNVYSTGIKQKYELVENMENTARPTYVLKTDYQYKYNGKEFQDELGLGLYDYGARMYDPAIGRWHVIDPMADISSQSSFSPYHYAANNPMFYIDPDGMIWKDPKEAERLKNNNSKTANNLEKDKQKWNDEISNLDKNDKKYDKKLSKLNDKIKDADDRIKMLGVANDNIDILGADQENTYAFSSSTMTNDNAGVRQGSDGIIYIENDGSDAVKNHETSHVATAIKASTQTGKNFLTFGENGYLQNFRSAHRAASNEIQAYKITYATDPSKMPSNVSTMSSINIKYISNLQNSDGSYTYPELRNFYLNNNK